MDKNLPVAITRCDKYDVPEIKALLEEQFSALGVNRTMFAGKRVVVKPNLVMSAPPERGATTDPAVAEAALTLLREYGAASVTVAESPGGPYQPALLKNHYVTTGIAGAAERAGAELNYDISSVQLAAPDAKQSKMFEVIKPIAEAEVIVSLSKLKTHTLTQLSGATKNFFGVIAGLEKVEMHARFKDYDDFFSMIVDLCERVHGICPVLNIVDGVVGMEGNGPTGGTPQHYNCIMSGLNPYNIDLAAASFLGLEGSVGIISEAQARGWCAASSSELTVLGAEPLSAFKRIRYLRRHEAGTEIQIDPEFPASERWLMKSSASVRDVRAELSGKDYKVIDKKANIDHSRCIRCYCCQELCRYRAIEIKRTDNEAVPMNAFVRV